MVERINPTLTRRFSTTSSRFFIMTMVVIFPPWQVPTMDHGIMGISHLICPRPEGPVLFGAGLSSWWWSSQWSWSGWSFEDTDGINWCWQRQAKTRLSVDVGALRHVKIVPWIAFSCILLHWVALNCIEYLSVPVPCELQTCCSTWKRKAGAPVRAKKGEKKQRKYWDGRRWISSSQSYIEKAGCCWWYITAQFFGMFRQILGWACKTH